MSLTTIRTLPSFEGSLIKKNPNHMLMEQNIIPFL